MLWECSDPMKSVLWPQCPDVDVDVDVKDARQARRVLPDSEVAAPTSMSQMRGMHGGNEMLQQQHHHRRFSSTTNDDADRTLTRDLEAHHPAPITMAIERSMSLGGVSWNDLCLYPTTDDYNVEPQNQRNDECHLYANDNSNHVRSDYDSFNDNISSTSRVSPSYAGRKRKKILWVATFGFIAVVAIALAVGMSVNREKGAQLSAAENVVLDNENSYNIIDRTNAPTYFPTAFGVSVSPVAPSLLSSPDNNNVVASDENTDFVVEQNNTLSPSSHSLSPTPDTTTYPMTSTQSLSESPSSQQNISSSDSIPVETIPTQQPSESLTSSSSAQGSNNLDLVSSGKDSSATATQSCLSIGLQTDKHGEETSWTLHLVNEQTDEVVELIASVDENTYEPNEKDLIEFYLDPGKYRFTLKDAYGDGFCCSNGSAGSYVISLDGHELINGGYYRFEQSYDILVGHDPELTMSERDLEWVEAHNIRRKDWHERYGETYVPLVWSVELAKAALNWAQVLVQKCDTEVWHETSVSEGENLAQNIGSSGSSYGQIYPPENVRLRVRLLVCCSSLLDLTITLFRSPLTFPHESRFSSDG